MSPEVQKRSNGAKAKCDTQAQLKQDNSAHDNKTKMKNRNADNCRGCTQRHRGRTAKDKVPAALEEKCISPSSSLTSTAPRDNTAEDEDDREDGEEKK